MRRTRDGAGPKADNDRYTLLHHQMTQKTQRPVHRRRLKHPLEAAGMVVLWALFRVLPVDWASGLGGWLGRTLGPRLGVTRRARRNLALALPERAAEHETIVRGMWENLGRTVAEYAHLARLTAPAAGRIEIIGAERLFALRDAGQPCLLVGAHLANWEIMPATAAQHDVPMVAIVRLPNNPYAAQLLERWRTVKGSRRAAKGSAGAREALSALKRGEVVGVLLDQKMNDGIATTFFAHRAMSANGPAQLALRTGAVVIPARLERAGGARFRLTCLPEIALPDSGDRRADAAALTQTLTDVIETWVRERPQEWLWLHRRWPAEAYRAAEPG